MNFLKKLITLTICFWFPTPLTFWALNLMGHKVHYKSRIGFSLLWISGKLVLEESTRIGRFNVIKINSLEIGKGGYIGNMNRISGPIDIVLLETAAIGNKNSIDRAPIGVTYGTAILKLGILSKITANHRLDCTRSITIGNYTTLAGHNSQLWTHGYYHDKQGPGRFRIDGEIEIGDNVYIGSMCVINGGIKITGQVVVGSNSCVSKSLLQPGTYVSQPLRFIAEGAETDARPKYNAVEGYTICEEVYEKKPLN
jgi:acetyltransferase-like isoleucine patch superfamily enzyme